MDGFEKEKEWSQGGKDQAEGFEGGRKEDARGLNRGYQEGFWGDRE